MKWGMGFSGLLLIVVALGAGCKSYNDKMGNALGNYRLGEYAVAARELEEVRKSAPERDQLLLCLEQGATERAAATTQPSNQSFDDAERWFAAFDEKAKLQLDQEAAAILVNQTVLNYEGYGYDRIMMNVYKAMNYLNAGDAGNARVEIRRIAESQLRCEQRYRAKIAQDQKANQKLQEEKQLKVDAGKTLESKEYQTAEDQVLSDFSEVADEARVEDQRHLTLYFNPFAEYLQGIFFLHSPYAGDAEVGRVAMRNTAGMIANQYIERDVADAERVASGERINKTYVILETGMAPRRDEVAIRLPVFVFNVAVHDTRVDYIGIAFPRLVKESDFVEYMTISTLDGNYRTLVLSDMDKIVAREFKNDLPRIITRAIISTVFKAAASYAAAEATKDKDPWAQLLVRGSMVLYQELTNRADLRTWRTLPKQVQLASMPTPTNGRLNITGPGGAVIAGLDLSPGRSHLVWIRMPSRSARAMIRTTPLN